MGRRNPLNIFKSLDRGPVEFKSRIHEKLGDAYLAATKDPITIPITASIKDSAEVMAGNGFRRLPVVESGTKKLLGIVTSMDIVNFMGGGEKFQIIEKKYKGNFLVAINAPVKLIMTRDVIYVDMDSSVADAVELMLEKRIGGLPVVDEEMRPVGLITERDILRLVSGIVGGARVEEVMSENVVAVEDSAPMIEVCRKMISSGFRRLPVLRDHELVGIVSSGDIVRFIGDNDVFERCILCDSREISQISVEEFMTRNVTIVSPETDLAKAVSLMLGRGLGGLPVVREKELVGIITERDVIEHVFS